MPQLTDATRVSGGEGEERGVKGEGGGGGGRREREREGERKGD